MENGDFLIGWESFGGEPTFYDIFVRRFTADGTPLGEEFEVSLSLNPQVSRYGFGLAARADGTFVVVWTDDAGDYKPGVSDLDFVGLLGTRFAADGTPMDNEPFSINVSIKGIQFAPAIAVSPRGDFFVTWTSFISSAPGTPLNQDLLGRRFGSDGRPLSGEIVLDRDGGLAGLAMASTGRGIIAWASPNGVFVRKLVAPAP